MVRFHGLCDGKIMVRKKIFFRFCNEMSTIFRKNFGARYLIFKYHRLIKCRSWNEGLSIRYLLHGKSMVRVFGQKLGTFLKTFSKKL